MSDPLEATQRWMHQALVFPQRADSGAIAGTFASGRLSGRDGLAIYQRSYVQRITRCMREQFPALCHALGEELFDDFVADYVRDKPPESHTLYDLGRRFPGFLEDSRPDRDAPLEARERWIDFMVDLARFERLVFTMFDAPGNEGRPFAVSATPDDLLRLQPCFAVARYRFDVAGYYHAVRQKQPAALPPAHLSFVALVRTDYLTRTVPLGEAHYLFLDAMAGGMGVADALEAVARQMSIEVEEVRRAWSTAADSPRALWLRMGFFVTPPPSTAHLA